MNSQPLNGRREATDDDGVVGCGNAKAVLLRLACALPALWSIGCAAERYSAAKLPLELQAPPVANPQRLDLSKLAMASASDDLIAHGDVLEIGVSVGLNASQQPYLYRVDNSGNVNLPIIGSVPVEGLDMEMAESQIRRTYVDRQVYRISPNVSVILRQQKKNDVLVIGAVQDPGRKELPARSSDLLRAIYEAGGLADDAGTDVTIKYPGGRDSQVRQAVPIAGGSPDGLSTVAHAVQETPQSGPRPIRIDLVSATESGTGGYPLEDGAIVVVEKREPMQVTVMGLVNKADTYEFPAAEEIRVSHAISRAGGKSSMVADKVLVRRRLPHLDEEKVIQLSLWQMKRDGGRSDLRLAPGDVVSVEETPATVLMNVFKFIRVGISAGGTFF